VVQFPLPQGDKAVQAEVTGWQDWPFLQQFEVVFVALYFDAITKWDKTLTPHAWRPLLRSRRDARLTRIQFAFAGMNAHINHDLAVALDRMAERDGRFPSRDGARYNGFRRVNDILERVEASLREALVTGLLGEIDQALGELDTILVMWNVRKAREAAWTNGEVLWHLRRGAPAAARVPRSTRSNDGLCRPRTAVAHDCDIDCAEPVITR
jgi:Family of unknown function (DUF5995)